VLERRSLCSNIPACGWTVARVTGVRHRGGVGVDSIRRGTYVEAGDRRLEDPAAAHRLGVAAAVRVLASGPGGAVVSHVSAAVLHGLPVWASLWTGCT
jgi:hypothetical protein